MIDRKAELRCITLLLAIMSMQSAYLSPLAVTSTHVIRSLLPQVSTRLLVQLL